MRVSRQSAVPVSRLMLVAVQLGLLFTAFRTFNLEASSGIHRILPLLFGGFVVHALIPDRFRLPLFVAIAIGSFAVVLGMPAIAVIAVALALLGVCHLPIRFGARVGLLVGAGMVLASLSLADNPLLDRILPGKSLAVLGSMLMFRLIIYMYDLRHERGEVSPWMRIAYFFLPPNVAFLLFPIVDFQAFRRTWYNRPSVEIYQKGVSWIFRGVTHLVLYRFVYYNLVPDPAQVASVTAVAMLIVTSWLLYLHVSGVFHIAIGMLCLFGFNLPETHRLYFLAASPSEVWRRANIYWKDFMMKVFYYPFYKALQKRGAGMQSALVIATLGVFAATWFLHSYQWFWLLGHFPLSLIHVAFWTVFCLLVLASTLLELRRGRARTLKRAAWSLRAALSHTIRVIAMFLLMAVMWSWWNTGDTSDWLYLLGMARVGTASEWAVIAAWLAGAIAAGVAIHFAANRFRLIRLDADTPFFQSAAITTAGALLILAVGNAEMRQLLPGRVGRIVATLQTEQLNIQDRRREARSYYEAIITSEQAGSPLIVTQAPREPSRLAPFRESAAVRQTGDYIVYDLLPSRTTVFRHDTIITNRWAMRDRDYELAKPARTWRAAVLGASIVMGYRTQGVTFETLLEARLNADKPSQGIERYELLNLAVNGYSLLQFTSVAENRASAFSPDVLILATIGEEIDFTRDNITRLITAGIALPPYVTELAGRAGVKRTSKQWAIQRRLGTGEFPYELHLWGYRQIVESCRKRGIIPVWAYLPSVMNSEAPEQYELLSKAARDAGFVTLDLRDAFKGVDSAAISLPRDLLHPNAFGHDLIARRLYDALVAEGDRVGLPRAPEEKAAAGHPTALNR